MARVGKKFVKFQLISIKSEKKHSESLRNVEMSCLNFDEVIYIAFENSQELKETNWMKFV